MDCTRLVDVEKEERGLSTASEETMEEEAEEEMKEEFGPVQ
jgi:hypothetical protein